MSTYIVQTDSKMAKALVAVFKALNVRFEEVKETNKEAITRVNKQTKQKMYNPEFVQMIMNSRIENGGILLTDEYKKELFHDL